MKAIFDKGCKLEYHDIDHPVFKNNLLFLDSCMPQFIADCLIIDSLPDSTSSVRSAVEKVAESNPFNFTGANKEAFYAHKMKVLLLDAALKGMGILSVIISTIEMMWRIIFIITHVLNVQVVVDIALVHCIMRMERFILN